MEVQWFIYVPIVIFAIAYYLLCRHYDYWKKRGIPHEPASSMIFGSFSFVLRKSFWEYFKEVAARHPDAEYVGMYMSYKPALLVQSPTLAKKILVKDTEYFEDRFAYSSRSADPLGSLNLFTVKNPLWSELRQHMSVMFTSARLKMITDLMGDNAVELVKRIQRDYVEDTLTVDLKSLFTMYTTDTVASSVFGIKMSSLRGDKSPLYDHIAKPMTTFNWFRAFEFITVFYLPMFASLLRLKFFSDESTKHIEKMFWDVVKERKKTGNMEGNDLVNYLLKLRDSAKLPDGADRKFADHLMLAQAGIFILGSVETSATTLTYLMHELAHHPKEQEKLFNVLDEAYKTTKRQILNYDDLMKLDYLSACIMETARKHSPLPHADRMCNKTYKLDDGLVIEKGTPVLINLPGIMCNPKYHTDPEEWRPDRITTISDNTNLDFTFLPFGEGPRYCIGKRYGMMQVRAAAAQIVHKFRLLPGPGPYVPLTDPKPVVLAPMWGGSVVFEPRESIHIPA